MPDQERAFALCRVGTLQFAVSSEHVVQAIPRPAEVRVLPRRTQGRNTPYFVLRGQVVPIEDLTRFLLATEPSEPQDDALRPPDKLMVLRLDGRWLAVEIDQLVGMQRGRGRLVVPLHHADTDGELFHSLLTTVRGQREDPPVALLDIEALFRLSGCWGPTLGGPSEDAAAATNLVDEGLATATTERLALLKTQGHSLLIDAHTLASVEPMPTVQRFTQVNPDVLGMVRWRGQDIQVMQWGSLLGERQGPAPAPLLAVLTDGHKTVGLAVDEAQHIQRIGPERIQDGRAGGMPPHGALRGLVYAQDGTRALVLDSAHLLAQAVDFGSPAAAAAPTSSPDGSPPAGRSNDEPVPAHVVFQAGPQWALAIDRIEAISAYPERLDPCHGSHPAQIGSLNWRGHAVALWDLQALSGAGSTRPDSECRVVLTQVHGHRVGLLTERLLMLLPARQGQLTELKRNGGPALRLISVQRDGRSHSFRVLKTEDLIPAVESAVGAQAEESQPSPQAGVSSA